MIHSPANVLGSPSRTCDHMYRVLLHHLSGTAEVCMSYSYVSSSLTLYRGRYSQTARDIDLYYRLCNKARTKKAQVRHAQLERVRCQTSSRSFYNWTQQSLTHKKNISIFRTMRLEKCLKIRRHGTVATLSPHKIRHGSSNFARSGSRVPQSFLMENP